MPTSLCNGVQLYWELAGSAGEPLILVHGSWVDHHSWDSVVGELARRFRVLRYDRRGHSLSEAPPGQGSSNDDVADLIALIEALELAPAHVAGNSFGAAITLRAAARRPDIFRSLVAHEPPVFGLLTGDPTTEPALAMVQERVGAVAELLARGELAAGAERFVETIAYGPGAWRQLTPELQQTFLRNAPTFLDELQEPDVAMLDLAALGNYRGRALLTRGTESPPFFHAVMGKIAGALPGAQEHLYHGAGHAPHLTHPADYVATVTRFASPEVLA